MITSRPMWEHDIEEQRQSSGGRPLAQPEPDKTPSGGAATAALAQPENPTQENAGAPAEVRLPPDQRVPVSNYGYRLPPTEPQHRAEVEQIGSWMRAAELPANVGRFIAEAAQQAAREPMDERALKRALGKMHDNLQNDWGGDYETNWDNLIAAIDRIDRQHEGRTWNWLNRHPEVLTSPFVVKTLARHFLSRKTK